MSADDGHLRVSYNEIHTLIGETSARIKAEFAPDLMVAIGGGGFIPARNTSSLACTAAHALSPAHISQDARPEGALAMYTSLMRRRTSVRKCVPAALTHAAIQAIGLSLYEELGLTADGAPSSEEKLGKEVIRTQWLDFSSLGHRPLIGRRLLIVDEVDDTRTTLSYAVSELQKDIAAQLERLPAEQRASLSKTELAIFTVYNKLKPKRAELPADVKYFAGSDVDRDAWIDFPWEQRDIELHEQLRAEQAKIGALNGH